MDTKPVVINEGVIKKGGLNPPPTNYRPPAPSPLKPPSQSSAPRPATGHSGQPPRR
jgi:hypothetical protein